MAAISFHTYTNETNMHEGTITSLRLDRGFGFIAAQNQPDTFFHANDLGDDLPFDEALEQRRVRLDIVETPKGPKASNIQPAG
jgi:cold shock CspA family protein